MTLITRICLEAKLATSPPVASGGGTSPQSPLAKRVSSSSADRLGTLGAWNSGEGTSPCSPLGKRVSSSSSARLGTPPRSASGEGTPPQSLLAKRVSSSSADRLGTFGAWDSGEGTPPHSPLAKRVSSSSSARLGTPPRSASGEGTSPQSLLVKRVSSSSADRLGTLGAWDSGEGALPSSPLGKRVSSSSADRLGTPPRSSLGLRNLSGSLFPYSASIISKNWGQKDSESSSGLRLKDEFSIGEIIANLPGEVSLNSFYVNSFYKKISKFSLENNKLPVLTSSKEVVLLPFRKIGEGVHTVVAELENHGTKLRDLGLLKENILDSDVVVKIPKTGTELSIRESFENSLNQYRNLTERYSYLPPEERPIARIYNADTAKIQGFYVQERVDPIEGAPWGKDESINSFTCQNRRILDVVTDLFRRSFVEDTGGTKPGIDLSFSNLGIRTGNGAPVLLDYMENDDAFSYNARICLRAVSNGNKEVKDYIIEGFDRKVEDPVRLSLLDSYKHE